LNRRDPRRGMILVSVLWSIALMTALAWAASTTFRGLSSVMGVSRDRVKIEGLLTAGLEAAAGIVRAASSPILEIETTINLEAGAVHVRVSDEGGRIDIGHAPLPVLVSLLHAVGAPPAADAVAQQIVDWRDPEAARSANVRLSNASPRNPSDQAFTDVRQLANIPGMDPKWVAAMGALTTVFGNDTVNPLTASAAVIAALPGVDPTRLNGFLALRAVPFKDPNSLGAALGPAQEYVKVAPQQAVAVELTAEVIDGYREAARAVIVVLPEDREPYRVLAWDPVPEDSVPKDSVPKDSVPRLAE
jgi:general secretion pathway protein K